MAEPLRTAKNPEDGLDGRWYALGLLLVVYAVHHIDRQLVTLLLEPIKLEMSLSDSQLGLLAGTSYAIAFAVAGLPMGYLIDRVNRVRMLALLITIWSVLTAVCGFAGGLLGLVLARVGVAMAESGATPTNLSILSDYFGPRQRGTAVGVYMSAPQIGTIVGFAIAAVVASAWGWRAAFLVVGIPGVVVALVVLLTLREPPRGGTGTIAAPAAAPVPFGTAVRRIAADRVLRNVIAGNVLSMAFAAGIATWLAPFLFRSFGLPVREVGLMLALIVSPFGAIGALLGGWLTARAKSHDQRLKLALITIFLPFPAVLFAIFAPTLTLAMVGFTFQVFLGAVSLSTCYTLILSLSDAQARGTTMAVVQVLSNVFGYGVGPQLVGMLSDVMPAAERGGSLPYAMAALSTILVWASLHIVSARRRLAQI